MHLARSEPNCKGSARGPLSPSLVMDFSSLFKRVGVLPDRMRAEMGSAFRPLM
jgi:hypothetical protein